MDGVLLTLQFHIGLNRQVQPHKIVQIQKLSMPEVSTTVCCAKQ